MMAVGCAGAACSTGDGTGTAGGGGSATCVGCSGGIMRVGLAPSVSHDGEASGAGAVCCTIVGWFTTGGGATG